MFTLYQDTKMSVAGVSFTIPKSFCIVVDEDFCPVKSDGLVFTTQEKNCCIEVSIEECDTVFRLYNNFKSIVYDDENTYTVRGDIDDRKDNVLHFIRAEYEDKHHSYFEMHMIQIKGYDKRLQVLITVEKGKADIRDILRREDVTQFINSFRATE